MRWLGCLSFAFVVGVASFAFGLSQSPDGFASRFAPALSMRPSMEWRPFTPVNSKGDRLRTASGSTSAQ